MADRYWVGGTANWDNIAGTKWSATSGGAGGASVPTTSDDVFFDASSSGTCTISSGNTGAKSINCTGFTGTITGNSAITVAGSITLDANMSYTFSGTMTVTGTGTLTTANKIIGGLNVNGAGITVTLGGSLNTGIRNLNVIQGTFDAAIYSVSCSTFSSSTSNIRTVIMGSGLWTITGLSWNMSDATNLTLNKGTANILLSNNASTLKNFTASENNLAFNKLTIGGNTSISTTIIRGNPSFTELASTKPVAHTVLLGGDNATIGVWSITGTVGNVVTVNSNVAGTRRTFNLTNVTSGIDYLNVKDIGVVQADRFYVGTNSTDGGNNLNVIFTNPPAPASTGNMLMLF